MKQQDMFWAARIDGEPVNGFFENVSQAFWYCVSEVEDMEDYDMRGSIDAPAREYSYMGHTIEVYPATPPMDEFNPWWLIPVAALSFVAGALAVIASRAQM